MVDWAQLYLFELIFMRMSGFLLFNPLLGRSNLPAMVKTGMALVLSILVFGTAGTGVPQPDTLVELAFRLLLELGIGLVLGFVMRVVFSVVQIGGEVIDTQMGMTMAQIYDASSQANLSVTASLLNILLILDFLAENGHYTLMRLLTTSGELVPYGAAALGDGVYAYVIELFLACMLLAVKLAMPILAAELLGEVGMGVLMKAIPQINAFVINIELKVIIGLLLFFLLLTPINEFLLELESGSNDPMAYMLTILLIGVVTNSQGGGGLGMSALYFVVQLVVGTLSGYLIGRLAVWTINKINLANHSLYSVLLLAFIFFAFAFTDLVKGNGYLAVYLAGLVVGNHKLAQKRSLTVFFDGFTWLMQIVMFLTLGLFVNSDELLRPEVLILGGAVGAFMILVARPVTVFACLLPFRRFTTKARLYVSWVGLRGAVPILFAIYPMMAGVEHAELLFNVVFLSTIISLLVQGTTVSGMANLLGLAYEERESAFNVEMHEEMKSALTEVEVNENLLASGHTLKDITLPENTLVMMVCRDGEYFVPQGKTELKLGDKLLVISDRSEELASTYKDMGIDDVMKLG